MVICGIDPGLSGGVAFIHGTGKFMGGFRMPLMVDEYSKKFKRVVDSALLFDELDTVEPNFIVIERVHAMPGQGVTSMFSFGRAFGQALAAAEVICQPTQVTPQAWKKHFGLVGGDKVASMAKATLIFGTDASWRYKADNGVAEAALMALWYLDKNNEQV